MPGRSARRISAAERRHLRLYGNLNEYNAKRDATPTQTMLYLACVEYRSLKFYHISAPDIKQRLEPVRVMIRAMAVTLVWQAAPSEPLSLAKVKAVERDYIQRARDDPPF